eukprot:g5156.t1
MNRHNLEEKLLPASSSKLPSIIAPMTTQEQSMTITFNRPKTGQGADSALCTMGCAPPRMKGYDGFSYPLFIQDIMTEQEWNSWESTLRRNVKRAEYDCSTTCCCFLLSCIPCACPCTGYTTLKDHEEGVSEVLSKATKEINSKYKSKGLLMSWKYSGRKDECGNAFDIHGRPGAVWKYHSVTIRLQRAYHDLSKMQQRAVPRPTDFDAATRPALSGTIVDARADEYKLETFDELLERLRLVPYKQKLAEDGFDSIEALMTLEDTDVEFMKAGHRRALIGEIAKRRAGRGL